MDRDDLKMLVTLLGYALLMLLSFIVAGLGVRLFLFAAFGGH